MTSLDQYGWQAYRSSHPQPIEMNGLILGRIVSIKGFKYYAQTENGELETELSGKLLYSAENTELPKVGDWVSLMAYDTMGYIIDVLPRKNALARRNPGAPTQKQILATNIDAAVIVQGLDREFNIMRLERYLVQLTACGIASIVVLNKADLVTDPAAYVDAVEKLQRPCTVQVCSTYTGMGLDALRQNLLQPGRTYVMIGSSGVGKSSLLNALMTSVTQAIGSTSEANKKGRHTTTTRDLFRLPQDSLLIDTPGMREFGLTGDEDAASDDLFPVIQRLAAQCRFNDCQHVDELGCAVIAALQHGSLPSEVYDSYVKLKKEQRRFEIDAEEKKRLNKQFGKITREAKNYRKKYKY
ncbi:ribosome small subunit-dependent GTPase A [Chryseolinea soli]|uniref:Small ribosomal subunit biogenesis GTPase RsgA n=1 Tax=Chryseolinea soli TaxID=2321403 RepID=A0A385SDV9_9BACT|nr:ribosome small subunit-dependent GTPase A [Chryseolinea soli]AYB29863.1 ribosome small subunit-dependent GTPase A [Chryseolinea soli]